MTTGKAILLSAPSGSGKTSIVLRLLKANPELAFSVSATTRSIRPEKEKNGVDYYFLTKEEFDKKVSQNEFIEWEEVYQGTCYGT